MGLSDQEARVLAQMEQHLRRENPRLARKLAHPARPLLLCALIFGLLWIPLIVLADVTGQFALGLAGIAVLSAGLTCGLLGGIRSVGHGPVH